MDTGKKLWRVEFEDVHCTFNIVAPTAGAAERAARRCAREDPSILRPLPKPMLIKQIRYIGTLDEPAKKAR
jgi:hypothetical protein